MHLHGADWYRNRTLLHTPRRGENSLHHHNIIPKQLKSQECGVQRQNQGDRVLPRDAWLGWNRGAAYMKRHSVQIAFWFDAAFQSVRDLFEY